MKARDSRGLTCLVRFPEPKTELGSLHNYTCCKLNMATNALRLLPPRGVYFTIIEIQTSRVTVTDQKTQWK